MSIALMAEVWKSSLPMTEKMVLLCLADFANDRGECWPSIDTIAAKCSCSDRTVQKAIKSLRERGLLRVDDAPGKCHSFVIASPRTKFTPERNSPPKNSARGVKNIRQGGEPDSPKPSKNHQEPSHSCASDDARFNVQDFVESWNEVANACGLPLLHKLTDRRKRAFEVRRREYPDIEDWRAAFRTLRTSRWLHGENGNGWRADPDFFLQAKSFTKLVEGAYGKAH